MYQIDDYDMRELQMRYPFALENNSECYKNKWDEIIIKTKDGEVYLYDLFDKSIRTLPEDRTNITEKQCRKEFGRRLRRIMWFRGMTQIELSEKTGIQQYAISNYTTGRTTPSFYIVDKIAKALHCSMDDFRYVE